MISKETCTKFNNILYKLGNHPASPELIYPFNELLWYSLQEVCSNGYSKWAKSDGISVFYSEKNYKKYKKEFDKELKCYKEDDPMRGLARISVPYKDFFGKPWEPSRIEYWGELNFCVFNGEDCSKYIDKANWICCHGFSCSALSYEEMVIKLGKQFLNSLGNKTNEDFLTVKEKNNHKKERMFFTNRETEDGRGFHIDRNPKYIEVNIAQINKRWQKWIKTSEYYKKNWKDSF